MNVVGSKSNPAQRGQAVTEENDSGCLSEGPSHGRRPVILKTHLTLFARTQARPRQTNAKKLKDSKCEEVFKGNSRQRKGKTEKAAT